VSCRGRRHGARRACVRARRECGRDKALLALGPCFGLSQGLTRSSKIKYTLKT
jgi:hypothetical protein